MAESAIPAVPRTAAQRDRYERILKAGWSMLGSGGEEALQMKDLPYRADVSLSTLYRYFPSKDHLLLAIALDMYERALRQVAGEPPHGDSVRERVTNHLLRQFRAEQRSPKLTAALYRVLGLTTPIHTEVLERIQQLHLAIIRTVAESDGVLISDQQVRVLPIIQGSWGVATRRWLAGTASAADARFEIRMSCRLLDLPDEEIKEELAQAMQAVGSGQSAS
jgi:AcrR family transcriptional regulator